MDEKLTDIERAWLVGIDALLMHGSPQGHVVTAGRIVDLWGAGGVEFQSELARRADVWRKRHMQVLQMAGDGAGPCSRLIQLMGNPTTVNLKPSTPPAPRRPRPKRGPVIRPSRAAHYPAKKMTDEEVKKFLKLVDEEGLDAVFDPGNSVTSDDVLFRPPLVVIDGVGVYHEDIAPKYDAGKIKREWDGSKTSPAWALAADLTLIVMLRERKWTWQIADRYYKRLPWRHPAKTTSTGRPGWKKITTVLSKSGLIERKSGRTWRLTDAGRDVAGFLADTWRSTGSVA
tara:strand:- start:137573 stop:138430 length:858 start_codon:yes stop_codon:yes gene_type:complete